MEIMTGERGLDAAIHGLHEVYLSSWKQLSLTRSFVSRADKNVRGDGSVAVGNSFRGWRAGGGQLWIVHHGKR